MLPSAAPPSPQEVQRKLSIHSVADLPKLPAASAAPVSGTESDSDSIDIMTPPSHVSNLQATVVNLPLSAIAETASASGEDSEEEAEEGGWKTADRQTPSHNADEGVIKAGYLRKKGQRRKTWKKRWFVLRPQHLAYYKSSAEYQLLRLLELSDVHSCTPVKLKRHAHAFGLVSSIRTFYLRAGNEAEVQAWVTAIEDARLSLRAADTTTSTNTVPIPIPAKRPHSQPPPPITQSPPHAYIGHNLTSSESDDASPVITQVPEQTYTPPPPLSPSKSTFPLIDPSKTVVSGYLMKCGHKRRTWRKRWFVLTGEKLVYSGSHMDIKPHRQFLLSDILDALEYDGSGQRQGTTPTVVSPPPALAVDEGETQPGRTFKIVTTKRTLLLCAPHEEDEIKWLSTIRALIARRVGNTTGSNVRTIPVSNEHPEVPPPTSLGNNNGSSKPGAQRPSTGSSVILTGNSE